MTKGWLRSWIKIFVCSRKKIMHFFCQVSCICDMFRDFAARFPTRDSDCTDLDVYHTCENNFLWDIMQQAGHLAIVVQRWCASSSAQYWVYVMRLWIYAVGTLHSRHIWSPRKAKVLMRDARDAASPSTKLSCFSASHQDDRRTRGAWTYRTADEVCRYMGVPALEGPN